MYINDLSLSLSLSPQVRALCRLAWQVPSVILAWERTEMAAKTPASASTRVWYG